MVSQYYHFTLKILTFSLLRYRGGDDASKAIYTHKLKLKGFNYNILIAHPVLFETTVNDNTVI